MFEKISFKTKIILFALLLNIGAFVVSAYYLYNSLTNRYDQIVNSAKDISLLISESLYSKIDKIDTLLYLAQDSVKLHKNNLSLSNTDLRYAIDVINARLPLASDLYIVTLAGKLIEFKSNELLDISDRPYFKEHLSGSTGLVFGDIITSRVNKATITTYSRLFLDDIKQPIGVGVVTIPLDYIRLVLNNSITDNAELILTSKDGKIYSSNKPNVAVNTTLFEHLSNEYKNFTLDTRGQNITVVRKLGNYPLYITYQVNKRSELASWYKDLQISLAFLCLLWLISSSGGYLIYRFMQRQNSMLVSLHRSEEQFRSSMENAPIGMALTSLSGTILTTNNAWRQLFETSVNDDAIYLYLFCDTQEHIDILKSHLDNAVNANIASTFELPMRTLFANERIIKLSVARSNPDSTNVIVQAEDLTNAKAYEKRLKLTSNVFENSGEGIVITDKTGKILSVNTAFTRLTGYSEPEAVGKYPYMFAAGPQDEALAQYNDIYNKLKNNNSWQGELCDRKKDGSTFIKWMTVTAILNEDSKVMNFVCMYTDITERKLAQDKISYLAYHDVLTGLPNRLVAFEEFDVLSKIATVNGTQIALMFLDLDGFKHVNDTLGHQIGDTLIKEVAKLIRSTLRTEDIVCRQGGDEFLIILPNLNNQDIIAETASTLINTLNKPFNLDGHMVPISTSIGVTIYSQDGNTFDTLLKHADTAMYSAKNEGKNTFRFFNTSMASNLLKHLEIRQELHKALTENPGQFILHYQPQLSIRTGKVIGAEALVRWQHPEKGLISPIEFIPVAEDSGLIVPLGEHVLTEACKQANAWHLDGLPGVSIAINMSAIQLRNLDVVSTVSKILHATQLPPNLLELELTESALMLDEERAMLILKAFRDLNINISIDDFGTGYSTFTYIKKLTANKIKLDRSFVSGIAHDAQDSAIVDAIIHMSKTMGLTTIAEGVETVDVLDALRELHCDEVQGYLFSKPLPLQEFIAFAKDKNS